MFPTLAAGADATPVLDDLAVRYAPHLDVIDLHLTSRRGDAEQFADMAVPRAAVVYDEVVLGDDVIVDRRDRLERGEEPPLPRARVGEIALPGVGVVGGTEALVDDRHVPVAVPPAIAKEPLDDLPRRTSDAFRSAHGFLPCVATTSQYRLPAPRLGPGRARRRLSCSRVGSVRLEWTGDLRFDGYDSANQPVDIDGSQALGAKPSDLLPLALAACTAYDVVTDLGDRLRSLTATAHYTQAPAPPWPFQKITLRWTVEGDGLDEAAVAEAFRKSEEEHCSIAATLRGNVTLESTFELR